METRVHAPPTVSFIIPAHNEELTIRQVVEACLAQSVDPLEVVVVDDGSTDKTGTIVNQLMTSHTKGHLIRLVRFSSGHSAAFARNRGAENATADVIIFIDADVVPDATMVEITRQVFADPSVVCGGYYWRLATPHTFVERTYAARYAYILQTELASLSRFTGYPTIWRREAFLSIGKFNESIFYYEDTDLRERAERAGYKIVHVPAYITSHNPATIGELLRQGTYMGKGVASILDKPTSSFLLSSILKPLSPGFWFLVGLFAFFTALTWVFAPVWTIAPGMGLLFLLFIILKELIQHIRYSHMVLESIAWVVFFSPLRGLYVIKGLVEHRVKRLVRAYAR